MLPYLNIGPLGLPTAPLIILLGLWLALYAVDRAARRLGREPEQLYALASVAALGGFVGARLVFVGLHWSSFDDYPLGIIWPLTSGYNGAGGIAIGAAAAFFYGRWRRLPLWPSLDALAPGLLVFLMAVSLAEFMSGAGYGSLTALPWGINQYGVRRHAVQLYEVAAGLAALGAWGLATAGKQRGDGRPFLIAMAVYAAGRLFVDAFKETTPLVWGGFHLVQIMALVVLSGSLFLLSQMSTTNSLDTSINHQD